MNLQLRDPGIFQLTGLPSGEYTLVVRGNPPRPAPPAPGTNPNPVIAPPAQAAQLSGRIDVTLGSSNLDNVVIRLTTGAEVTGKITVEGGVDLSSFGVALPGVANAASRQAAGGAAVPAQAPPLRLPSVMLASIEGPSAQLMSIANPDGTFRIANVPPLKRVLQVSLLPPNAYIKSVRFRGQDATRTPLDLSTGSGGVLDILIGIKGAEITATPRDEKGEAPQGTSVSIWPRTPNPGSPTGDARVTITGERGRGLGPGRILRRRVGNTRCGPHPCPGVSSALQFTGHEAERRGGGIDQCRTENHPPPDNGKRSRPVPVGTTGLCS